MSSQPLKSDGSSRWGVSCRPTLLFVVAFALNVTPHEIVHAIVWRLGVSFSSSFREIKERWPIGCNTG